MVKTTPMSRVVAGLAHLAWAIPAAVSLPLVASAQAPPQDEPKAIRLMLEGQELRDKGNHAGALEKFRQAYSALPNPVIGLALAQELVTLGKLLEAKETLMNACQLPESDKETAKSKKARVDTALLLVDVATRIPVLQVSVRGVPAGQDMTLEVGGKTVSQAAGDQGIPLDPGSYEVVARTETRSEQRKEVQLRERDRLRIELTFSNPSMDRVAIAPIAPTASTSVSSTPSAAPTATSEPTEPTEPGAPKQSRGRLEFGVRSGYGLPLGDVDQGEAMKDFWTGMVPIWLDAGYEFNRSLYVGAYYHYGAAFVSDSQCANLSCSGRVIRFGAMVRYTAAKLGELLPWVGVGFGYESTSLTVTANGAEATVGVSGLEFLNLQTGFDFELTSSIKMGPFVSYSMGRFGTLSVKSPSTGGAEQSQDIPNKATHSWFVFGLRGAYHIDL